VFAFALESRSSKSARALTVIISV